MRRGDIFIRGIEGRSAGAGGHTGIFLAKDKIIHCSYRANGVSIQDMEKGLGFVLDRKRSARERYFRPIDRRMSQERIIDKIGMAIIRVATNVRAAPSVYAPIVAVYYPGAKVYYDRLVEAEGYIRASYIGSVSGKRRYVALERRGG